MKNEKRFREASARSRGLALRTGGCLGAMLLTCLFSFPAHAADAIWVGPGDTPGAGTRDNPCTFTQALAPSAGTAALAKPGATVYLLAGPYKPSYPNTIKESQESSPKVFHMEVQGEKDNPIKVMPAPGAKVYLDGCLEINSAHLAVVNLEIGNSKYDPMVNYPAVVNLTESRDVQIINCNLFGGCSTVTTLQGNKDIVIYGCLVHDSCGLPHGSSNFYVHNSADSTKVVERCVGYRSSDYNLGVHVYAADDAHNVKFLENILFLGGCVAPKRNQDNIYVNPGSPFDGLEVIGNVAYQYETASDWRPNTRFSSKRDAKKYDYTNARGVVKDNWIMGGLYAVSMGRWKQMTFENNTLWAQKLMIEINSSTVADGIPTQEQKPNLSGYRMDKNHYFTTPDALSFRYDRVAKLDQGDPLLNFSQWQALGLDKDGVLEKTANGRPTGTMVRVFPNRYEKGRANVAIFNWDGKDSVKVDLSKALAKGDAYQVYNCIEVTHTLAAAKPVLTGTYDGGEVSFPMKRDPASPDFDAFVVLPRGEIVRADEKR